VIFCRKPSIVEPGSEEDDDRSRSSTALDCAQCELASISRSSFYRKPTAEREEALRLMRLIDEQFLETPWYGSRRMARHLRRGGWHIGRHRVRRLMLKMGLAPIYQRQKTSEPHPQHRTWPYLLRDLTIAVRTRSGAQT
jgi:putative transposase